MTSRGEHYSSRDQVPRAGTFDQATLILYANEKRINQKELVDLIIRTGRRVEDQTRGTVSQVMVKQRYVLRVEAWMLNVHVGLKYTYSMHMECGNILHHLMGTNWGQTLSPSIIKELFISSDSRRKCLHNKDSSCISILKPRPSLSLAAMRSGVRSPLAPPKLYIMDS
jgi:hypothetical protein